MRRPTASENDTWLDEDAGRLVRPYTVVNGRTKPTANLDLMSLVMDTGRVPSSHLDVDHSQVLGLCRGPTSIAEIAALLRLPAMVTKVLLCDLVDCGAATVQAPNPNLNANDRTLLEALLNGLQRRL